MGRKTIYNNLTSHESISQINPDNINLMNDFLDYLKSVQRSPGTISGYKSDLEIFFVWVLNNLDNKNFTDITKRELVRFQNWLIKDNKNSAARVRRLKAAISSLSNYIESILDEEEEFKNFRSIVRKIESPVLQPTREKTVMETEDVDRLLEILVSKEQYDKACALALAVFSGRRKSELLRFRMTDFSEDRIVCDGALYKSAPIQTKGRGGGKYVPCYVLRKDFKPYLDSWIKYREENNIDSEWLFPDKKDNTKHMEISTLNSWANCFSKLLDIDFYWHSARHWFTTHLAKSGIPDGVIAEIVAWADVSMVKVYTDIDADEQIGMYFKDGEIVANKKNLSEI